MTLNVSTAETELSALAEALHNLRTRIAEHAALGIQQAELRTQIESASGSLDLNDSKAVAKLTQDRTRLDLFQQRIEAAAGLIAEARENLREAIIAFCTVFNRQAQNVRTSTQESLETAMRDAGIPKYKIDLRMAELLDDSDAIRAVDGLSNFVAPLAVNSIKSEQGLLNSAQRLFQTFGVAILDD